MDNRTIAIALKQLEDGEGRLTPDAVVEAASDPMHELHDQFEWDDGVAGPKYRIAQARALIGRVRVIVDVQDRTMSTVGYVRDPAMPAGEQGYRSTAMIAKEPDEARNAVVSEFSRASAHLKRARDLAAAMGYFDEIANLVEAVESISDRIHAPEASA